MLFRKFTAGKYAYGSDLDLSAEEKSQQLDNVYFKDANGDLREKIANGPNEQALRRYFTFLSVCHTIVVDKGKYNAASPDELALVNFAK